MQAILFDLDGTLLDIDLDAFFGDYFTALGPVVAEVSGVGVEQALQAVLTGTQAMSMPHPGRTNMDVFAESFTVATGKQLSDGEWDRFARFYSETFPSLRKGHGPNPGAREAVEAAKATGMKVAIATNPLFPAAAIRERIRWAGLDGIEFDLVTSYETMQATKPHPGYYLQVAAELGVDARDCLMVGDDRALDMPAADVGMRTFFVGPGTAPTADYTGTLGDLAALLPRLVSA